MVNRGAHDGGSDASDAGDDGDAGDDDGDDDDGVDDKYRVSQKNVT